MAVVGLAEVLVQPSFKGAQKDIAKHFDPAAQSAGKSSGGKLSGSFGKAIKGGLAVTGLAAGAFMATALTKGLGRLQAIEGAKAKLKGLGHDADAVSGIMENALASVKGTSFGLGDAATAAAGLVASGIQPGKDLEKVLKSVTNSAAAAGVDMGEVGSIYQKVASSGKAQNDVLSQVADKGIPIYQALAKELGVTAGAVFDMAKDGAIDFDTFEKAMTTASGTVADEMGKTLPGALKNAWAAIGRFGANLMSDVYPQITGFVSGFIDQMGPLEDKAKVIGAFLGDALKGAVTWISNNKDAIIGFLPVLATAVGGLAAYFAITKTMAAFKAIQTWYAATTFAQKGLNAAMKANPIGLVVAAITLLVAGLVWLYKNNETARRVMDAAWAGIKNAVIGAWEGFIKPAFSAINNFVKNVLGPAFVWFRDSVIKPVWEFIKTAISNHWNNIKIVFSAISNFLRATLGPAFTWLRDAVIVPVWSAIRSAISGAWSFVKPIFSAIGGFLRNTLGPAFTWFRNSVIKPVWDGIAGNISTVWNKMIKPVFDVLMNVVKGDMPAAFEAGKKAIKSIWEGIKSIARSPVVAIVDVVYNNGLKALFNGISDKLGLKWKLPDVTVPQFAKGGQMGHGWKLVGEEGPELINTGPGYVYTANETKRMLNGKSQMPMGAIEQGQQAHEGIGGWSDIWGGVKSTFGGVKDWVVGQVGRAVTAMVKPIKGMIGGLLPGSGINDLMRGGVNKLIDDMTGWAVKKDDAAALADGGGFGGGAGGSFGGGYSGPLGRFFRPNGPITSGFGSSRGRYPHAGIDFAVPIGTAVKAMFDGVIRKNGWNAVPGRSGKGQIIDHGQGYSSYTGHLSGWTKQPGERVKAGETTALSGNTGRSTGPHAHRELWKNGKPFNFMSYLHDNGGVLNPGLSMIMNNTRKPEAIYNHQQNANLQTLAKHAAQNLAQPSGTDAEAMRYALHGMEIKMQTESGTVFAKLVNKGVSDLTRGKKSILS